MDILPDEATDRMLKDVRRTAKKMSGMPKDEAHVEASKRILQGHIDQTAKDLESAQAGKQARDAYAPPQPRPKAAQAPAAVVPPVEPQNAPEAAPAPQEAPSGDAMAAKNVDVEAQAEAAGLPKALKGESISFKDEFAKQKAKIDADPLAGEKLVDELNQTPRPITHQEQALLAHEMIRVSNGLHASDAELDKPDLTPEQRAHALTQNAHWEERWNKFQEVNRKAGTQSSLALLARKIGLKNDYTYDGVAKSLERAKGSPLEKTERDVARQMSDALTKAQKAAEDAHGKTAEDDLARTQEVFGEVKKRAAGSGRRVTREEISKRIKEAFLGKKKGEIKASNPDAANEGLPEVTQTHQNAAVENLKKTEIGRRVLRDAIIVPNWEATLAHGAFTERGFSGKDINTIKRAEGFHDPQTGKSVVIRDNVRPENGETPEQSVRRVLLHERVGHDGLTALRKLDPKFDKEWHSIASEIPEEELEAIKGAYPNSDREELINEWFARKFGAQDPNAIPDPKTVFGRMWQAIKDFVARYFGDSTKLDQRTRDLMGAVLRSDEAMEPRRGFGDVVASDTGKKITPTEDRAYLDAVQNGDTETAQKMVDEAAKRAGYDPDTMLHGASGDKFNSFDFKRKSSERTHGQTPSTRGITWVTDNPKAAGMFAVMSAVKKTGGDPLNVGLHIPKIGDKNPIDSWPQYKDTRIEKLFIKGDFSEVHMNPNGDSEGIGSLVHDAIAKARKEGKDGVVFYNLKDFYVQRKAVALFKDALIKSADTITRDANDRVIPLSERFNPESNDIRFSLPEETEEPKSIKDVPHSLLELIARYHLENGMDAEGAQKVHELTGKIQQTLAEEGVHASPEEIHREISNYGKQVKPSADEVDKQMRDMRSQMLKLSALKDVREDKMPELTGRLRDDPSKEVRDLEKEIKDEIENRKLVRGTEEEQRASALDAKKSRLSNEIEDVEKQLSDLKADKDVQQRTRNVIKNDPEAEVLEQKLKGLRKERDEIDTARNSQTPITPNEYRKAIDRVMQRKQKQLDELQRRMDEKDFSKVAKKPAPTSRETEAADIELGRKRQDYANLLQKYRLGQRTKGQKFWDNVVRAKRAFILSGATVLGKLQAAAGARGLATTAEELINHGLHAVLPEGLTSKAKLEGQGNVTGYAKAYAKAYGRWLDDIKSIYKTGATDVDVLHGPYKGQREEGMDSFLGRLHYMLKAPVKRAAFDHAMEKLTVSAIRDGLDISDETVKARLGTEAYKAANRAIFMQDNALVKAFQGGLSILEKQGGYGPGLARTMRVLFPIVKVPSNMVGEALQYAGGVPIGLTKLARVWSKGFENLKPEEADLIMRQLKKGSLGSALMTLGFLASSSVGGYYEEHEKRKLGEAKAGGIKVAGIDIPSWLMHSPAFEAIQMGATLRRVAESHNKEGANRGLGAGSLAALYGVVSETPFVNEMTRAGDLKSAEGREQYLGDLAKAQVEPQLMQQIASATDSGPKRKAENLTQNLELGVPGLRQNVPVKVSDALPPSDKGKIPPAIEKWSMAGNPLPGAPQRGELRKTNPNLNEQTFQKYAEARGRLVKSMLLNDIPNMNALPEEQRHAAIAAISHQATARAKEQLGLH